MRKIYIDGITREMTPGEEAELAKMQAEMPPPDPTPEERLSALEQENAYLKEALNLLLEGVTADG